MKFQFQIDVNQTSKSKECDVCQYWYLSFNNKGCKFQSNVCSRCHDLLMMYMNLSDITILNTRSANYPCIISGISKSEAISFIPI